MPVSFFRAGCTCSAAQVMYLAALSKRSFMGGPETQVSGSKMGGTGFLTVPRRVGSRGERKSDSYSECLRLCGTFKIRNIQGLRCFPCPPRGRLGSWLANHGNKFQWVAVFVNSIPAVLESMHPRGHAKRFRT